MIRYAAAAFAAFMISAPSFAHEPVNLPPSVTVSGIGRVQTRPDMAEINIGVATQAPTAAAALTANNTAMTNLINTLKAAGIEEKDILTSNFSVNPEYQQDRPEPMDRPQPPRIVGYRVDNSVQVKVRALAKLGAILDAVVRSGANNVNGISFAVAQPEPILDKARTNAVSDARRKAELYATAAGVKVGRVLYITESGGMMPPPSPRFYAMEAAQAKDSSVPIATGEQTMESTVQIIYAIEP